MRRVLFLGLLLALAACDSTPSDLIDDPTPPEASGDLQIVSTGTFEGVGGHRVSGRVTLYRRADGSHLVRLEDLDSQAGPDLKVWLVQRFSGDVARGHVSLGALRSTRGNQNYEVPAGSDLSAIVGVSVWCERFGVGFGQAAL